MAQILQDKLKLQGKAVKQLQRELATEQLLLDKIREVVSVLDIPKKLPQIQRKEKKIDVREVIVAFADWHAGEKVELAQMEGRNEYNLDIMFGRIWNLLRGIVRIVDSQRNSFEIDTLNIDMLGDMVSGDDVHDELRETNEFPILQTTLISAFITAQAIAMLVPHFNLVRVTGVVGNHGRKTKKPAFKNKVFNNYDYLFYQLVSLHLRKYIEEGRIEFNIPQSPECITIRQGWSFLLGHSDQIKGYLGLPFYGFTRDTANQQKMRKLKSVISSNEGMQSAEDLEGAIINFENARSVFGFDYREAGHFHTMAILDNYSTILCPSIVGANEYSVNKLHVASSPAQALAFLSKKWGIKGVEMVHVYNKGHNFKLFKSGDIIGEMAKYIGDDLED